MNQSIKILLSSYINMSILALHYKNNYLRTRSITMKFSYSLSKRFSLPILILQFFIIHSVSSLNLTNDYLNHKCFLNQGKYKSGSEYDENLIWIFNDIRTVPYEVTGFSRLSVGKTPDDFVAVTSQCRGDTYESKCRTCIGTAISGFRKRCPSNKGGIIWYDQCLLYINTIKEKVPEPINYKNIISMYNPNNVRGDAELFATRVMEFFSELTLKVKKTTKYSLILYAAGEKKLGKNKLYAMVQCLELSMNCKSCLTWSISKLFKNEIKQGARVLGTNCDVRYELYPFLRS
ncbi:putative cysteine-rich repeat secretory protein 37 [Raphanus sativus]|uniref:Cysteine-rich repeat secretory protein 37 n=1 Tax=Raphanus sativus TaxID=3726 RepID=A0A6J0M9S6_RAPSA|nr:putative cysteine-rich repeat secretory protein 37 [Raphanus sativus]